MSEQNQAPNVGQINQLTTHPADQLTAASQQLQQHAAQAVPQVGQPLPADAKVPEQSQAQPKRVKRVWTRNDVKRYVPVAVHLPFLYNTDPDVEGEELYDPFEFKFRFAMSREMEDQKQEFLSKSALEQEAGDFEQSLDEICDLLVALPTGFGDLPDMLTSEPGQVFKNYVKSTTDPDALNQLQKIVKQAAGLYYTMVTPRAFLRKV